MNGYYARQYTDSGLRRMGAGPGAGSAEEDMMGIIEGMDLTGAGGIVGGQSLDDIVSQNAKEMRRRTIPFESDPSGIDTDLRRVQMMDFSGTSPVTPLGDFTFEPTPAPGMDGIIRQPNSLRRQNSTPQRRPTSLATDIPLTTQFAGTTANYDGIAAPGSAYATSPLGLETPLEMDMTTPYAPSTMPMTLDLTDPSMSAMITNDVSHLSMYQQPQFASPLIPSTIPQDFPPPMPPRSQDVGNGPTADQREFVNQNQRRPSDDMRESRTKSQQQPQQQQQQQQPQQSQQQPQQQQSQQKQQQSMQPPSISPNVASQGPTDQMSNLVLGQESQYPSDQGPDAANQTNGNGNSKFPWPMPSGGGFPTSLNKVQMESQFKNAYSATGFDMLGVLMRVATRPNPEINIGSVDLSCAFVVCDAQKDDMPIIYCSDNFERLTGYNRHMILGRNCRFLQSPDGKVEPGIKRKYVDDESVLYLKNMIAMRREAQISLINYRRGGQPFMNLLTMIPIGWDSDDIRYFVGFQVDLVEQPNSVTNRNPDGSYSINYQRGVSLPRYVMSAAETAPQLDLGQTIPRDDVSAVLSTFGSGEPELSKRIWDKLLLENTDDVVHVLSLKGLFLYLSPSSRKVLEYEASELVGRALSSVCHPSDIVPVTRELKETTAGSSVNVVFRIRRKESGYMWFEGHGSLHTEQGKGRKCIILVGRERPVYALSKTDILASGGIGDNELWSKISTAGMFLFVASNVRQLLDRTPEEMVGTSIQSLMRQDSKSEFSRILEICRTGKKASIKHEMINKRGQVLQAFSTIYPGDAVEGQKPTFMIAQTRLLKQSRGSNQRPQMYQKQERESSNSLHSGGSVHSGNGARNPSAENTPKTTHSGQEYVTTQGVAPTYSGHNGLALGHQDDSLASDENVFDELKTTRSTSWQYELRQMEKRNRLLAEEVQTLLAAKKKRKRRKGAGQLQKDCANCHTRVTPEWRRGPSGNRDLCNSCGLRWAKQNGRVSPRTPSQPSVHSAQSDKASIASASPRNTQAVLPNQTMEASGQSSIPSTMTAVDQKTPGQKANADSHAAKIARMEVGASQGLAAGVPPKIEELAEPD